MLLRADSLESRRFYPDICSRAQLEEFDRVDIDGPANLACIGIGFQHRPEVAEHLVQYAAISALQQELRAIAAGTTRHRCINRAERPQSPARKPGDESGGDIEEGVSIASARCR